MAESPLAVLAKLQKEKEEIVNQNQKQIQQPQKQLKIKKNHPINRNENENDENENGNENETENENESRSTIQKLEHQLQLQRRQPRQQLNTKEDQSHLQQILSVSLETVVALDMKNNELIDQLKQQKSLQFNFDDIRNRHKQDVEALQKSMNDKYQTLFEKYQTVLEVNIKLAQENATLKAENDKLSQRIDTVEKELKGMKQSLEWRQFLLNIESYIMKGLCGPTKNKFPTFVDAISTPNNTRIITDAKTKNNPLADPQLLQRISSFMKIQKDEVSINIAHAEVADWNTNFSKLHSTLAENPGYLDTFDVWLKNEQNQIQQEFQKPN